MLLFQAAIIAQTSQNMSTKTGGLFDVNQRADRMSWKRFHDIQTPRQRGAPLKAVIGAMDQNSCLSGPMLVPIRNQSPSQQRNLP